jgi:tRNA pseudouridine38-40 synthase
MQEASHYLLGEQDFSSFRSSQCRANTPMRCVMEVTLQHHGDFILLEIEANAFLHHMVRNIIGVLTRIGTGFKKPEWVKEVLQAKDRRAAAETAPASGLYLIRVRYPEPYIFPISEQLVLL